MKNSKSIGHTFEIRNNSKLQNRTKNTEHKDANYYLRDMSQLLKDIYSLEFIENLGKCLKAIIPATDVREFTWAATAEPWDELALKARMSRLSLTLHRFLPSDFESASDYLIPLVEQLRKSEARENSFEYMFIPEFVEKYGAKHFEISVNLMEQLTPFASCEFAVRPFIIQYGNAMMEKMLGWSLHKSHHVRRLSSEGCRPRLPWAMALPEFKKNPAPLLPILHNLKGDESEYVRRSVANNLNDISKDNPDIFREILNQWKGKNPLTDSLLKHAARTLLKQGDPETLAHFGWMDAGHISLLHFRLHQKRIPMGGLLHFDFSVKNNARKSAQIRLEYALYFLRNGDKYSKKVFKIGEKELPPGELLDMSFRQSFKPITTRRYYPGIQKIALILNGKEYDAQEFMLHP